MNSNFFVSFLYMILSVIIKISSFFGLSPSNQCTAAKSCHADFLSVLHSLFCFTQFSRSYLPLNLRKHACTGSFPWFIPIFPPSCRSPPSTLRADRDVPIAYSALHRPALPYPALPCPALLLLKRPCVHNSFMPYPSFLAGSPASSSALLTFMLI